MKAVVDDNYLYIVSGRPRVNKTMATGDHMLELVDNPFGDVVSPWKLRITGMYPDEVHFGLRVQHVNLQSFLNKKTMH